MREIGSAAMPIIPSFDGIKDQLERGIGRPMQQTGDSAGKKFGDSAGKSLTSSLSRHAKKAALVASGALVVGAAGAFKFGSDAVSLAADLEQSVGAIDTVFGKSAKRMHKWAKGAANDVGLTRNEFNELGTLIGSQLKNGGTAMDRLAPKTNKLIKLGADLSSMFGGQTSEAVEALSSALKGERDPIERYGVSLNQAKIDAEAAALGFEKVDGALSSQAQQAATLSLIMKQTADAHGNFAKEADTLSGKQQRLKASLEDTKTEIGTALLPIVADAADFLLKEGVPAFQAFADWFSDEGIPAIHDFGQEVKPLAEEVLPAVGSALDTVKNALKSAAPYAKDLVGAFNDMPEWAKNGAVLGAVGLGVASKVKPGKGGAASLLGGAGKGATAANPMYVWVVNGGGVPGKGGGPIVAGAPKGGLSATGIGLAIAGGVVVTQNAPNWWTGMQDADGAASPIASDIRDALANSDVGKYADKLGINIDALAAGLAAEGKNSQEFKDAVEVFKTANDGFWEDANDLIPVIGSWISTTGDQAAFALRDLASIVEGLNTGLRPLLAGDPPPGAGQSIDITTTWEKIPPGTLKLLQDPTTVQTRKDVREILENVDGLNRKDFKLIFSALGLSKAKDDAETLLKYMRELTGMAPVGGSGAPSGLNPFAGRRTRTGIDPAALGRLSVGNINVQANDVDRLVGELTEISRRTAIGGFQ